MNFRFQLTILFLLSLIISSCSLTNTDTNEKTDQIPADAIAIEHQSVAIGAETIDQSQNGSYDFEDKTELIIENEESYVTFWEKLHEQVSPTPDLPAVDFNEFTVVVVMMGIQPSGGYSIEIERVAFDGDAIWFDIEEREPGTGCGTAAVLTSPYHVIKIPVEAADTKKYRFLTDRIAVNCEN
jgi:hypothetical protein